MTKVYVLDCNELLAFLTTDASQCIGPVAEHCNFIGVIETLLDEYFYNALFNKVTAVALVSTLGIPSEPAELMVGVCRKMLTNQLKVLLCNVPADRWLDYKVLPWGEINIIDYIDDCTFMDNKLSSIGYLEHLDAERKALEESKPTPQFRAAIVREINEGTWVPESLRRFAHL